jgi:hypothetical protein
MENNAEKFLRLEHTVKQLRGATELYTKTVAPATCDKHGIGFNKDNRFTAFEVSVRFSSWAGWYGSSSCSSVISFSDPDAVKNAFIKYLNSNWQQIFDALADIIEKESIESKNKYIADLKNELERLEAE